MILPQVALHLNGCVGIVQGLSVAYKVIAHVRCPAWRRGEGQVFGFTGLMEQDAVDVGERVGKVEPLYGMEVNVSFSADDSCVALHVLVGVVAVGLHTVEPLCEDVIVDEVGKQ